MNRERMKKIGRMIFKKRKAMNLTLGQLSEMLYATPQAVHNYATLILDKSQPLWYTKKRTEIQQKLR